MIEAYPLYWPEGWKRCNYPQGSQFNCTFGKARAGLINEICRLGGSDIILSTNIPLRQDGLPYASAREPDDSGVAVYFKHKGNDMVFACDKYVLAWENMVAIRKTIEAIRGIERWGASDMMERAFRGFIAIEDGSSEWRSILEIGESNSLHDAEQNYKRLRSRYHPDKDGGDRNMFIQLQKAIEQARVNL